MHQILVYADSLSWGIIPGTRKRLPFNDRWPGVFEQQLLRGGHHVRVIEDCLNGRRTAWDDPFKPGRNGLVGLEQRIESCSPLSLVMILLGTNDFQSVHQLGASESARGVGSLVGAIHRAPIEPGMPQPEILLIAPPSIRAAEGPIASKFANAQAKSQGLSEAIREVAMETSCEFFDAAEIATTSKIDGVHLDQEQQYILGIALAEKAASILPSNGGEST